MGITEMSDEQHGIELMAFNEDGPLGLIYDLHGNTTGYVTTKVVGSDPHQIDVWVIDKLGKHIGYVRLPADQWRLLK